MEVGANLTSDRSPGLLSPASCGVFAFLTRLLAGAAQATTHNPPAVHRLHTSCELAHDESNLTFALDLSMQTAYICEPWKSPSSRPPHSQFA